MNSDMMRSIGVGAAGAYASLTETVGSLPHQILPAVASTPDNWADVQKGLISVAAAILSQSLLLLSNKLLTKLKNARRNRKKTSPQISAETK